MQEPTAIVQNAKIENDVKPKAEKVEEKKPEVPSNAGEEISQPQEQIKTEQPSNLQVEGGRKRHNDVSRHHRHYRRDKDLTNSLNDSANLKRARNDLEQSNTKGNLGRGLSPTSSRRSPRRVSPAGRRYRPRRERRRRSEERKSFKKKGRCRDYEG